MLNNGGERSRMEQNVQADPTQNRRFGISRASHGSGFAVAFMDLIRS